MIAPSRRFEKVPPYLFAEISRIKREAIASGADVIDLGIGDPDQPTPQGVRQALKDAVENPETHRYDETPRGWLPFLDGAAEWYARNFGVELESTRDFCQVIGSKEGLAHLAWAYIDPGDLSIVPDPGYTVYKINTQMAGGEVHETPLLEANDWLPDLTEIPTDVARRAKLFYVCYPHNPTGAVATREFYEDLVRFAKDHDILIVNDMAYSTVTYEGFKNPTVLQVEGAMDVAIEFHSLSKMYNMTGWRLGFAVGNPEAVQTLQKLKDNIDSKQFPAIAEAGGYALRHLDNEETMRVYQQRRDNLCDGLNAIGWEVKKPKATFYVWTKVPKHGMSSAEFCKALLEQCHIVTIPGNGYGQFGEGYLRMSLTLPGDRNGERFAEAVERIKTSGLVDND